MDDPLRDVIVISIICLILVIISYYVGIATCNVNAAATPAAP